MKTKTLAISPDVRAVLEKATIGADRLALNGQLDRSLYVAVNKILEAGGGKWDKKAKVHLFDRDPREVFGLVAATGKITVEKVVDEQQTFQAFYTPDDLADRMVKLAQIDATSIILEPSAGNGALIRAMLRGGADRRRISAIEIRERETETIFTDLRVAVKTCDFLEFGTVLDREFFTTIVANPPFAKDQDISHIEHMLAFLKPGGRLVTISSPGWTFRTTKRHVAFRERVSGPLWTREELPEGTFKESGTNVRAMLLTYHKPA